MKYTLSSVVLALVLAGCAGRRTLSPLGLGPYSIPSKSVSMVAGKKGEYVALMPKGTLSVQLQSNTAAGYHWKLAEPLNPAVLTLVSRTNPELPPVALAPAGLTKPDSETWVFKAVGPGTQKVRMIYSRPDQPLGDSVSYDFTVNAE